MSIKKPSFRQIKDYIKELGNPYASLSIFDQPDEHPQTKVQNVQLNRLTKTDFQLRCRQVFQQYIPPVERGHLRPHHRNFIARNEQRSAEQRYILWKELSRYDLSTTGNYRPHFNREYDSLTIEKLLEIERTVESGGN